MENIFNLFSQMDRFCISFNKKTEQIFRDTFVEVSAIYIPNLNVYKILKTEKDFKTKKEYKIYLKDYKDKICTLYKSDYIKENNPLGTVLFDFLKYDFSNFDSYCKFAFKYGAPAIFDMNEGSEKLTHPFLNCKKVKTINGKQATYITPDEFTKICKISYTESRIKYLSMQQNLYKSALKFSNNLVNYDYLKNLTIKQRFFVYQNTNSLLFSAITSTLLFNTSISYSLNLLKDSSVLNEFIKDEHNNPEELAHFIETYKNDFQKMPTQLISYSCRQIESACFISLLQLIQNEIPVNICKNCGNFFIPTSKKNTLYCNNIYENNKTCQNIGAIITYNEKLKKDEITSLYRKTLSAKKMLANRNPDIPMYLEQYEQWKKEANEFRKKIKNGKSTEEEFKNWIEETRK